MNFICVIFQVQDASDYHIGLDYPPDVIDFCIIPLSYAFVLCAELKLGIGVVSAS